MPSYSDRAGLELVFGKSNVEKWADVNNDENAADVDARVTWALEQGYEYVNDRLRDGPYAIPFTLPAPATIKLLNERFAGVLLYESRGVTDVDGQGKPMHALAYHRDWVEKTIAQIFARQLRLNLTPQVTTYPQVLREEDEADYL